MALIGYHASHEQFSPRELIGYVREAESAGFAAAMCSDHFHPWSDQQGHSGFAWSWLGASMQATSLSHGVVCAPGQRYHPAIVAQSAATMAEMFPGRFWIAVGSGQALNEHITGDKWPTKADRNARLKESVDVMRELWTGAEVTHRGLVTVEEARLYTLPEQLPIIVGAAITPETARWMGGWADALITIEQSREALTQVVDAFCEGGGEGKPMYLQVQLSYAETEERARQSAFEQWGTNMLQSSVLSDLRMPGQLMAAVKHLREEDIETQVRVSSDLNRHIDWLQQCAELGFERMYLHNVNQDQRAFIEVFGERVLPALRSGD